MCRYLFSRLVLVETKCTVDLKSITAQANNKNATVEVLARSSLIKIKPREQFCFADEIAHVLLSYGVILVEMCTENIFQSSE